MLFSKIIFWLRFDSCLLLSFFNPYLFCPLSQCFCDKFTHNFWDRLVDRSKNSSRIDGISHKIGIANINSVEKTWMAVISSVASAEIEETTKWKARNSTKIHFKPRITIKLSQLQDSHRLGKIWLIIGISKVQTVSILLRHRAQSIWPNYHQAKQSCRERKKKQSFSVVKRIFWVK